jgi:hypothetical protein
VTVKEIIHSKCGAVAFHYDDPVGGDAILSARTTLLDGSKAAPGDLMRCGSCGELCLTYELRIGDAVTATP